ncbi:MAG TPA: DUF6328 family protein [Propionicimonas sp.]|jgi:hypothetical protein|uniref:DUF6328 family protein n=1 Tax=Propionicimonas sp. TaxID=1955623 RepID=UPI002F414EC7
MAAPEQRREAGDVAEAERDETPTERFDRNWSELLQELRVAQTGIQILSGFLLTLPFQARFKDLAPVLVVVFLAAAVLATLSTALVVAPVTAHRILFRRHAKGLLVDVGDAMAKIGLNCLALTVVLVVVLVFGFVVDVTAGLVAGAICLLVFAVLWLALPMALTARGRTASGESAPTRG